MKKFLVLALACLLIAGVGAAWFLSKPAVLVDPSVPGPAGTGEISMANTPPPVTDVAGSVNTEPSESISPAKRIRHGKAGEQELENAEFERPSFGSERADRLARRVEAGLDGEIDALIDLSRMIGSCQRGMGNEERVQERLDRMAEFNSRNPGGPVMPGRGGGSVEYRSFEDLEADMWVQFDRCQVAKDVLDESLYEQVKRLAESGLPSARYLYSVWPPDQHGMIALNTLELLEYQSLALEYTWLNMQARDPLGMLAMAQSYSARRPQMFTPGNAIQGQVFLLASMKCGIDNEWLDERSANFGQRFSRFQGRNTEIPSLDEDAAALTEMFCPLTVDEE